MTDNNSNKPSQDAEQPETKVTGNESATATAENAEAATVTTETAEAAPAETQPATATATDVANDNA